MKPALSTLILLSLATGLTACSEPPADEPLFEDVTELSGIEFVHRNGSDGTLSLPIIMGSGVALFDVDNDGDLDMYFVQGAGAADGHDEVWLNETEGQRLRFARMPHQSALESVSPGVGVAIGDANLDGRLDVLVTTVGRNRLLLNSDTGFIASASEELQRDRAWSSSAVWVDVNADRRPDLYVGNVAQFDPRIECLSDTRRPDYCGADAYVPLHDQLLLNFGTTDDGDVIFEDVSHDWNLDAVRAPTLGVYGADLSGDARVDVYATSFGMDNALWINRRGRAFQERAVIAGTASSFLGRYRSSLGVDAADFDSDGDIDLVVAHDRGEPHQLYLNDGQANFLAEALADGGVSEAHSGSGLVVFDADADGRTDVFVANGAVRQRQLQLDASDALPLRDSNALFLQHSTRLGRSLPMMVSTADDSVSVGGSVTPPAHEEVGARPADRIVQFMQAEQSAGFLTPRPQVSRSVASGDLDNDGDVDLVITNNGGPAQVLRSTLNPSDWLGIDPVLDEPGTTAVGAQITFEEPALPGIRNVRRTQGYLSASDPRQLYYGVLEGAERIVLSIQWPDGSRERFVLLPEARYHRLVRGRGQS